MASVEAKAFDAFYDKLAAVIQHSVDSVVNEAVSALLLTPQQAQKCLHEGQADYEKAETLLQMIGARIDVP